MTTTEDEIRSKLNSYLKQEFFSETPEVLDEQTGLLSGGYIDSLSVMMLVEFIENSFHIELEPHEVDPDNLDTVDRMVVFVEAKLAE